MDAPSIFSLMRDQTNTNIYDYPDTRLLPYLNLVKDDLFSYLITGAGESWNWDIWNTATVSWQTEYVIPLAASDTEGNMKIDTVNINYNGETYKDWSLQYIKCNEIKPSTLPKPWNYYKNNQSKESPIYYIADKSIFIAPATENSETDWIELKGIKTIPNYTITTTESNIKIPLYLHDVLVQWGLPYIHKSEGRKDEASYETKEYERRRDLAVNKFKNRSTWPHFMSFPDELETRSDDLILNIN